MGFAGQRELVEVPRTSHSTAVVGKEDKIEAGGTISTADLGLQQTAALQSCSSLPAESC